MDAMWSASTGRASAASVSSRGEVSDSKRGDVSVLPALVLAGSVRSSAGGVAAGSCSDEWCVATMGGMLISPRR